MIQDDGSTRPWSADAADSGGGADAADDGGRDLSVTELDDETIAGLPFERAFKALERAVGQLEDNELDLDASLALYERGVALAERCDELLEAAELRVREVDGEGQDVGPVPR